MKSKARETGDRSYRTGSGSDRMQTLNLERVHNPGSQIIRELNAGIRSLPQAVLYQIFLPSASRTHLIQINCDPTDESVGYFRSSAARTIYSAFRAHTHQVILALRSRPRLWLILQCC